MLFLIQVHFLNVVGLQLFLMKRGGQEIYVGPLGRNSCHLIKYFEVEIYLHEFLTSDYLPWMCKSVNVSSLHSL